jgi:hypothetical protein
MSGVRPKVGRVVQPADITQLAAPSIMDFFGTALATSNRDTLVR